MIFGDNVDENHQFIKIMIIAYFLNEDSSLLTGKSS
jgi:hypothetical protein